MNLEAIVPLSLILCDIIACTEVNLSIKIRRLLTLKIKNTDSVREMFSITALRLIDKIIKESEENEKINEPALCAHRTASNT